MYTLARSVSFGTEYACSIVHGRISHSIPSTSLHVAVTDSRNASTHVSYPPTTRRIFPAPDRSRHALASSGSYGGTMSGV